MQLELKQVFSEEGFRLSFEGELDLSDEELYGAFPYVKPIILRGTVENKSAVVMLRYHASVGFSRECDRCLDPAEAMLEYDFEHVLVAVEEKGKHAAAKKNQDESDILSDDRSDELVFVPDFRLELDDVAREDILLETPTRFLCRQECKGLCPKCGCNLNHAQCNCDLSQPDPRLAALRDLLSGADE